MEETRTMIFYESPHKLIKTLTNFCEYFGEDRQVSVSRELTKLYEETVRGTIKKVLDYYTNKSPKGEIVIVVSGKK
jgi:16S rRNA (cytidine1402-2'-O)-methyltransferase